MGHRQEMTRGQRLEWDIKNYKARLQSMRGHNHSYMTDKLYKHLEKQGYETWDFGRHTVSEEVAIAKRDELRKQGHYARIVSSANRLRIREYELYYKGRMIVDPDADGTQWLYRGMGISEQKHPNLLPYACYDWEKDSLLIGVAMSKKEAMTMIDKYVAHTKNTKVK